MGRATPKPSARKANDPPVTPINFRMPRDLRARLRRFARQRHLGEADALRLVVSERLEEVQNEQEMAEAERWQLAEAYRTWDRFRAGQGRTASHEGIRGIFTDALAGREATGRTR